MQFNIKNLLIKLWFMCLSSAGILIIIYSLCGNRFDITFYKILITLCLGYLPYTLLYKRLSYKFQKNILFFNMCLVVILIDIFIPFSNQMVIIFLPLLTIIYKNTLVFYLTSFLTVIYHFGFKSLSHHISMIDVLIELSYFIFYFILLSIVVNLVIDQSKTAYIFKKTVKTLILAIEAKDLYTRGHSIRVSEYSLIIGKHMNAHGYNVNLETLKISSLIHDIGKIYIPDGILTKEGKLTNEEYKTIQKHSEFGAQLAEDLEYPSQVVEDILYHHERHDGKGYPKGLKGNEIPLHSKIIALADTFDAITSTRSYRQAFSLEDAKNIILENMNSQFDPELSDVFLATYPLLVEKHKNVNSENYIHF